jgi:hypothetical protein
VKSLRSATLRVSLRIVCVSFSIILFLAMAAEVAARPPAREGRHGSWRHTPRRSPRARQSAPAAGPKIWLQDPQRLPVTHVGAHPEDTGGTALAGGSTTQDLAHNNLAQNPIGTNSHPSPAQVNNDAAARSIASGQARPLSLTKGDFDHDGVEDLMVGYAIPTGGASLHRGNLDAFAPQNQASFEAIGRGEFPAPFLREARVMGIPVEPDFLAAGDFAGKGDLDLAVAARGGSAVYIFAGDGKGKFGVPEVVNLPGGVTNMAAGAFGNPAQGIKLFVATSSRANGYALSVFGRTDEGLSSLGAYPLNGAASNIEFGDFGDSGPAAAFLSSGQVYILHSSLQLESVSLPVSASALALGNFIYDRNSGVQIALWRLTGVSRSQPTTSLILGLTRFRNSMPFGGPD